MKKIVYLCGLFVLLVASSAYALSWAYPFVVWKGNVYEVKQEEILDESSLGKVIGKVNVEADDMTGEYYGDASNYYKKGTKYYEIKGVPTAEAIAVEDGEHWVKAVYVHKAPFHMNNMLTHPLFKSAVILVIVIGVGFYLRKRNLL